MSYKELLEKGKNLYRTGIGVLDDELPNGFPCNAFGVIRGPGGGGKSVILNEIAKCMMEAGKSVIYVCFEDTPLSVLQNLCSLGWDYATMLDKGLIRLVDCFSTQILHRTAPSEHTTLVSDPSEPDQIGEAIRAIIQESNRRKIGAIFMDSITELFLQSQPFKAVNAVKAWRATFCKELSIPFWATYHTGLQQFSAYDDIITYISDVIVDTRHEPAFSKAGVLIKQFRVTKVKGAAHNPIWVTFDVGIKGIRNVGMDEIKQIAKSITRFESPGPEGD
ncbi:MAG: hypothetical protein C4K49_03425 [Candidatus Thorarchaeota archaeon]|nr:MAG: hypothetical protein C4K49_03425 [Candidatus Thorarchaeota archaeon]